MHKLCYHRCTSATRIHHFSPKTFGFARDFTVRSNCSRLLLLDFINIREEKKALRSVLEHSLQGQQSAPSISAKKEKKIERRKSDLPSLARLTFLKSMTFLHWLSADLLRCEWKPKSCYSFRVVSRLVDKRLRPKVEAKRESKSDVSRWFTANFTMLLMRIRNRLELISWPLFSSEFLRRPVSLCYIDLERL